MKHDLSFLATLMAVLCMTLLPVKEGLADIGLPDPADQGDPMDFIDQPLGETDDGICGTKDVPCRELAFLVEVSPKVMPRDLQINLQAYRVRLDTEMTMALPVYGVVLHTTFNPRQAAELLYGLPGVRSVEQTQVIRSRSETELQSDRLLEFE